MGMGIETEIDLYAIDLFHFPKGYSDQSSQNLFVRHSACVWLLL